MSSDMNKAKAKTAKEARSRFAGRQPLLNEFLDKQVTIITNDGRNFVGHLRGLDQVCNIILDKSVERVFTKDSPVQSVSLGLYVVRGDNIAIVGLVDPEEDDKTAWQSIKGDPLKPVVH